MNDSRSLTVTISSMMSRSIGVVIGQMYNGTLLPMVGGVIILGMLAMLFIKLAEKKAAYADYRKAREEMKELLTAKANIDRILELDKEQEEANERREKEAEQR